MSSIGYKARNAIYQTLKQSFNANIQAACHAYRVPPYQINFNPSSTSFYFTRVDYSDLQRAGYANDTPAMLVYTTGWTENNSGDRQALKFEMFSGVVTCNVDVYLPIKKSAVSTDSETLADATDEAIVNTLNTPSAAPHMSTGGLVYNGDISVQRSPVKFDGENWIQAMRYVLQFRVVNQT